jgi:hypothetical protein
MHQKACWCLQTTWLRMTQAMDDQLQKSRLLLQRWLNVATRAAGSCSVQRTHTTVLWSPAAPDCVPACLPACLRKTNVYPSSTCVQPPNSIVSNTTSAQRNCNHPWLNVAQNMMPRPICNNTMPLQPEQQAHAPRKEPLCRQQQPRAS